MKKLLFIKPLKSRDLIDDADWNGIENALKHEFGGDFEVEITDFDQLAYLADGKNSKIWHITKDYDIADFDLVIIRRVGGELERAISIAHYLSSKHTRFIDTYLLTQGKGKLAGAFVRTEHGISAPKTFSCSSEFIEQVKQFDKLFEFPLIVKADEGRKGKDNYLVNTKAELISILKDNPKTHYVIQPFIENDGDYRILVLNGVPRLVIHRKGAEGSHLNNTSQGGTADIMSLDLLDKNILIDCVVVAGIEQLQVAGVDVIIDKNSGEYYILEVNRAPQLSTGAFKTEKLNAYTSMISEIVSNKKPVNLYRPFIGNVEDVLLRDENITLKARIDTGAKTSAIWATNIHITDGNLLFELLGSDNSLYTGKIHSTKNFKETVVSSSNGIAEKRYKVKLNIELAGRKIYGYFTLADRSTQVYPVLIGRNILRGKFIVDVSRGTPLLVEEKARTKALRRGSNIG